MERNITIYKYVKQKLLLMEEYKFWQFKLGSIEWRKIIKKV